MDASGNLYGTTYAGGANGDGTVFELAKGSAALTTVVAFDPMAGGDPQGDLTLDASGNVYGITGGSPPTAGGPNADRYGSVFEIAQGSGTLTTLAAFHQANGSYPYGA